MFYYMVVNIAEWLNKQLDDWIYCLNSPICLVLSGVGGTDGSAVSWFEGAFSVDLAGTSSCWVSQVVDSITKYENTTVLDFWDS